MRGRVNFYFSSEACPSFKTVFYGSTRILLACIGSIELFISKNMRSLKFKNVFILIHMNCFKNRKGIEDQQKKKNTHTHVWDIEPLASSFSISSQRFHAWISNTKIAMVILIKIHFTVFYLYAIMSKIYSVTDVLILLKNYAIRTTFLEKAFPLISQLLTTDFTNRTIFFIIIFRFKSDIQYLKKFIFTRCIMKCCNLHEILLLP